jgi:O-antigen/teichoic acid export membrane protein
MRTAGRRRAKRKKITKDKRQLNINSLFKNTITYAIGNIGMRLASFLLIPLYTHSLSIEDYGIAVTLLLTIQVLLTITGLGTPKGFIRFAEEYEKQNSIGNLLGSTLLINIVTNLLLTGLCATCLLPFFRSILHADHISEYIILAGFAALAQSLFGIVISYFRVKNQGIKYVVSCLAVFLILIVSNFLFLRILFWGIKGVLIAQILSYGGLWVVILLMVVSKTGIRATKQVIKMLVKFSFPLVFAMAGDQVGGISTIYFISYYVSLEQVAIYSLANKIAAISVMVLILPFQLAYEPFVYANNKAEGIKTTISNILTYFMLCFSFMAFGIVFIFRDMFPLIAPPEYYPAYSLVFVFLPVLAATGVYYIAESLLNIQNKTKIVGTVVTSFTVLHLILNFFLIKGWGISGAIISVYIIRIGTVLVLFVAGLNFFPIPIEWKRLSISGLLMALFLCAVFFLQKTNNFIFYSFIPAIAAAVLLYIYFGNFCSDREKAIIKDFFHAMRSRVTRSAPGIS